MAPKPSSERRDETMAACANVEEWSSLETAGLGGLIVRRPLSPGHFQAAADKLASDGRMGSAGSIKQRVEKKTLESLDGFAGVAAQLAAPLDLPAELSELIQADANAIGKQLLQMLPKTETFDVTLDLMGENVCSRWHVDSYIGRVIVTYNSHGTEWLDPWNVDYWELENCGNSDCIIRDKDEIHQASVGDIVLMKGSGFEPGNRGLVHKSPIPRFQADGSVVHRLCLKVDAPLMR